MGIMLNADIGESFGNYIIGNDEEVIKYVDMVNIACGFHAGDPIVMDKTVQLAKIHGVRVGAHPGYRDLFGFGRRTIIASPKEVETDILYQIAALYGFCRKHGVEMYHVKPHGALYNFAAQHYEVALAIANAIKSFNPELYLVGLYNSQLTKAAQDMGLKFLAEGFADRHYDKNGKLVSRSIDGSVIHDLREIKHRVESIIEHGIVKTMEGDTIEIKVDTICVHGDNENAVNITKELNRLLKQRR